MKNMKKKPDCHQALRVTNLLFWSGFVLLILSIAVSGTADSVVLPGVLAILGVTSMTAGLVCGFLYVKCPSCGES
ncbi:hypothetical protein [uncultured Dysosmobacter sp.]|uniref:hypothetical protein n=1 Tax=uncultured Dysosmobacter sp. TaxID=2591384 RepID=UPI002612910A|nr:hypothetical protein [uncultured Dysosmobacter sp.]